MKKVLLSCFILISILFSFVSANAATSDFSCSFEDAGDVNLWNGAIVDSSAAYTGDYGIVVQNPFGEVRDGKITNVLELNSQIYLEAGKIYTLSGYAMNPDSLRSSSARCSASMSDGSKNIIVSVLGINSDWARFSVTFYSGESGNFNLSLYFEETSDELGVFVDDLVFEEVECTLSSIGLYGEEEILIPPSGSIKVTYNPYLLSSTDEKVFLLTKSMIHATARETDGIRFDSSNLSLTVSDNAKPNTFVDIHFALKNDQSTTPSTFSVFLTNNLIDNSTFDNDAENYWLGEFYQQIEGDNNYIRTQTTDYSEIGYFAQLEYAQPVLLVENTMYVLHARVKSDSEFLNVNLENGAFEYDNTIYFAINNATGNEWHDIFVTFFPETSGIYNIDLLLYSQDDCTFYIDDIKLCAETLAPSQITIHAPGNIPVPDEATSFPATAYVRDQLGNILEDEYCSVSLLGSNDSVFYDSVSKTITVLPDADIGEYTLCAVYDGVVSLSSKINITVSRDYIGDGTFENKQVNEWWMASSPYGYSFNIVDNGESKQAHIMCDGEYFALINNSYIHLMENGAYVFKGNFSASTDATVTVFLDTLDGELIPLIQFPVSENTPIDTTITPEIFRSETNTVGRLMFYCSSDNGGGFLLRADNLSLKKALITVASPSVSGSLYVNGAAHAEFGFYNGITEDNDKSSCVVNWYVSDKPNSDFTLLGENGFYIYFDTTFANKYVYFDVTPVCPVTGFSGDTLSCTPFLVTYEQSENQEIAPPEQEDITPPTQDIQPPDVANCEFEDIDSHWAKESISYLMKKGVVNGKSEGVFEPDSSITRGEMAKILCLAFSVNMKNYENAFLDVPDDVWFAPYVNALYANGLVKGTSADTFSPYKEITREELAVLIMRIYEKKKGTIIFYDDYLFNDSYAVSSWAQQSVNKAVSLKLIMGDDKNCFLPAKSTTRAEACTLVYRLLKLNKK